VSVNFLVFPDWTLRRAHTGDSNLKELEIPVQDSGVPLCYCFARYWRRSGVGDIPNRYTNDVVLNQQARVAHQGWYGGFAIPGGPVAEVDTAVLDAGAYGGSSDMSMADPETDPW
jgi:hypothetical protein